MDISYFVDNTVKTLGYTNLKKDLRESVEQGEGRLRIDSRLRDTRSVSELDVILSFLQLLFP